MENLAPKLNKITVSTGKLILDPNNPRLITRDEDLEEEEDFTNQNLQTKISAKINSNTGEKDYKIKDLVQSIRENGWCPIDLIFVRKLSKGDAYVVLEGNRRVSAIRNILNSDSHSDADDRLKAQIESIEVMEIVDDLPDEQILRKISYLLGVRHQGSLIKWTPFARAQNTFKRYLEISDLNWNSFYWDENLCSRVSSSLSISKKDVLEGLKVYRAMRQIGEHPLIKDSNGEVKGHHYSIFAEPLIGTTTKIKEYVEQDETSLLLSEEGIMKFDNLCHISTPNRDGSPIKNNQEWRKFEKILGEEMDENERKEMIRKVEVDKQLPSDVYAEHYAKVTALQWDRWLLKVGSILKTVTLGDDLNSDEAINTTSRLVSLTNNLDERDI